MNILLKSGVALLATASLFISGCANQTRKSSVESVDDTARAAAKAGASHFVVVDFDKNSDILSADAKRALRDLAAQAARAGKEVEEVKVLAWADREYPAESTVEPARHDVALADKRSEAIRKYLKGMGDDMDESFNIDEVNMAKRSSGISRWFGTSDSETRSAFESTGAAPVRDSDSRSLIGSKASKAVILAEYAND